MHVQLCTKSKRPIHTRDFAPGACSRGTLREQSSSVCTNDFMGILHPREQNFHPAKCSTIFDRLNIWEQAPRANWANLKRSLVCTDTCKISLEHAPGANPPCVSAFIQSCSINKRPLIWNRKITTGVKSFEAWSFRITSNLTCLETYKNIKTIHCSET